MTETSLLWPILLPAAAGLVVLTMRKSFGPLRGGLAFLAALANLALAIQLFGQAQGNGLRLEAPWVGLGGLGLEFSLRLYPLSGFILLAVGGACLLVTLFSLRFMSGQRHEGLFYACLLFTAGLANGAVLADHLMVLLFFWEGLLLTLFGMIAIGGPNAFKTATKAFIIVAVTDICLMLGIGLTGYLSHTLTMSRIAAHPLAPEGLGALAMILMMIGAISKAGSMPFHSWIPDAAVDAPLPFMALLPASLEKLLGIYLLARISLDLFALTEHSWVSLLMMIVGSATILLAVMMALVQKNYKRLLSYHAISQVGYMVLGIGTAVPVGIVGGLFHMVNNAVYKSCLFLTGGAVEMRAGTSDLAGLGGLGRKMPVTFACYAVAALSISGVPPFNGFFSKELVYDGALERHWVFYAAALLGSFLTAASFLKLGHAAYLGPRRPEHEKVREAPASMLLPMVVLAGFCVFFGLFNVVPLDGLIAPAIGHAAGERFGGWPGSSLLVTLTVAVLLAALLNHLYGAKRYGGGLHAADHIHHAPLLAGIYARAEHRAFDPYDIALKLVSVVSFVAWAADRVIDWVYDRLVVAIATGLGRLVRLAHTGNYALYVVWCLIGSAAVIAYLVMQ